jgi:glycosyltransferase involved in cell wall biosynthesis
VADRRLHIAIDGRELVGRPTGVGRYLGQIMRQWAQGPDRHRYTVVLPAEPPADLRSLGPRFAWHVEPAAVAGTWWEQLRLPRVLARERPDVLFAPGYTAPLRARCPVVLAVYDVSFFAHPEWFGRREGARRRWLTRAAARRASAVVTISEFSRDEIERYVGVGRERIVLAPPGANAVDRPDGARRSPLVLYVGSLFGRRHVPDTIRAFASAAAQVPDARLVLVGDNRTAPRIDPLAIAAEAGAAGRVEWRAYVNDNDLDDLYQSARVFVFLSDYEGFGMTPLEALAHGVPAILLDTPVNREVYADGAIRVPPASIQAGAAAALIRLLTDDAAHASALSAGRARLSAFSWARSADAITRALEAAAR